MKNINLSSEFDSILENVDKLNEQDAKSLLKLIYGYLHMIEDKDNPNQTKEFVEQTLTIYNSYLSKTIHLRQEQQNTSK
ncbi:hypothetical protein E0M25_27385 [Bacillus mycoides]|uniref:hypothetical protein n=1 Tax=Bacillus cereus group TaxID=86661 RepID=UPI0010390B0E|nr:MULTISPECIES: hypothetical protein [Bacillus cereus group]TBX71395.1 hypothetical protein E0M25_27385 [Bacillus mycoides]